METKKVTSLNSEKLSEQLAKLTEENIQNYVNSRYDGQSNDPAITDQVFLWLEENAEWSPELDDSEEANEWKEKMENRGYKVFDSGMEGTRSNIYLAIRIKNNKK